MIRGREFRHSPATVKFLQKFYPELVEGLMKKLKSENQEFDKNLRSRGVAKRIGKCSLRVAVFFYLILRRIMKKFLKSLTFPAISLLVIATIYAGISISSISNKTALLKKQNQNMSEQINGLAEVIHENQNKINQTISLNNDLQKNLKSAQSQIALLQGNTSNKTTSAVATEPTVVTQTLTQTVVKEVEANQAVVIIRNVGSYKVDIQPGDSAFSVLKRAAANNNFNLLFDTYSFGIFIKSIGGATPTGNQYWAFFYNGNFSNVGASDQPVKKGDSIVWQLESF